MRKLEYLWKERRYYKKENTIFLHSERPFKWSQVIFYFIGLIIIIIIIIMIISIIIIIIIIIIMWLWLCDYDYDYYNHDSTVGPMRLAKKSLAPALSGQIYFKMIAVAVESLGDPFALEHRKKAYETHVASTH